MTVITSLFSNLQNSKIMKQKTKYEEESMKNSHAYLFIIIACIIGLLAGSCSRSISIERAAQGRAKCGMFIR